MLRRVRQIEQGLWFRRCQTREFCPELVRAGIGNDPGDTVASKIARNVAVTRRYQGEYPRRMERLLPGFVSQRAEHARLGACPIRHAASHVATGTERPGRQFSGNPVGTLSALGRRRASSDRGTTVWRASKGARRGGCRSLSFGRLGTHRTRNSRATSKQSTPRRPRGAVARTYRSAGNSPSSLWRLHSLRDRFVPARALSLDASRLVPGAGRGARLRWAKPEP